MKTAFVFAILSLLQMCHAISMASFESMANYMDQIEQEGQVGKNVEYRGFGNLSRIPLAKQLEKFVKDFRTLWL